MNDIDNPHTDKNDIDTTHPSTGYIYNSSPKNNTFYALKYLLFGATLMAFASWIVLLTTLISSLLFADWVC